MPTTTNLIEDVKFEETTVDHFLSTVQETVPATSTPQQNNWTILGGTIYRKKDNGIINPVVLSTQQPIHFLAGSPALNH